MLGFQQQSRENHDYQRIQHILGHLVSFERLDMLNSQGRKLSKRQCY